MSRRVLLSLVPERREDLDHARRRLSYDRLILATGPDRRALAETIAAEENDTGKERVDVARILDLPAHDIMATHRALTGEVGRARGDTVILNAGGGNTSQLLAMIMVAFHRSLDTYFVQHGHIQRLPILRGMPLPQWFPDDEATMMHALAMDGEVATLESRLARGRTATQKTLAALTKKGLVTIRVQAGRAHAVVTDIGRLLLQHIPDLQKATP